LRPWFDRESEGEPIGEVWLTGDDCVAETGVHRGQRLGGIFERSPEAMLGLGTPETGSPLLLKVIFAKDKLSVQVHPDDALAQKYGFPRGKTECWYALAADAGAQVACGLKAGVTLATLREGIRTETLEESLKVLDVATGEMVFVDAGTVHAIWPGSILLETQQNCDLTYRMYDYGRGRELHIDKSIEATRLETRAGKMTPLELSDRTILADAEYFRVERMAGSRASQSLRGEDETRPGLSYLFAAAGTGRVVSPEFEAVELPLRGIVAIPASSPEFVVEDLGGLELIRITPNWPDGER
jgi:mannose-6-phosphate isomerase